jgi:hypothetical protein
LVKITKAFIRPNSAPEFFAGNHLAWALEQYFQQLQRLLLYAYPHPCLAKFSRVETDFVGPEPHDGRLSRWLHMDARLSTKSSMLSRDDCGYVRQQMQEYQ